MKGLNSAFCETAPPSCSKSPPAEPLGTTRRQRRQPDTEHSQRACGGKVRNKKCASDRGETRRVHNMCTTCVSYVFHMCFTVVELLKHGDRSLEYTRITRRIHEKCSETSGNRIGCLEANALQFRRRSRPHRPWFLPLKM